VWCRLAEAQEEILWVCEAAHMPVVWTIQALESLAKNGIPSRSEITDAAMGDRAECGMLNKRPVYNCIRANLRRCFYGACSLTMRRRIRCCGSFIGPALFKRASDLLFKAVR
jgi:hypothetical protein